MRRLRGWSKMQRDSRMKMPHIMKVKAKLDLENYAYKMKNDINSKILGAMLPFTIQKKFKDDVERVIQWSIDDR